MTARTSDLPTGARTALRPDVVRFGRASFIVNRRVVACAGVLTAVAAVLFAVRVGTSEFPMTPVAVVRILLGGGTRIENVVVFENQLPVALVCVLVGFALGMSGALTQTVARNPLATPDLLGITSGAGAAAVLMITAGSTLPTCASAVGVPAAALIGGLATAVGMYALSWRKGLDPIRLVLVGVALTAGLQAFIAFMLTRGAIDDVHRAQTWIVGSVSGVGWDAVWPLTAVLIPATAMMAILSSKLAALSLGEDIGRGLGLRVGRDAGVILFVAVVVTAVAVSAAGPIAFVALLAPQIAMRLSRTSIPGPVTSGMVGSSLVAGGDVLCQTVLPAGLPVGVVTAGLGGPVLIALMIQINRRASA